MNQQINDMRGKSYTANCLQVVEGKLYYSGFPVKDIVHANDYRSKHFYIILSKGDFIIGNIALTQDDFKAAKIILLKSPNRAIHI